MDRRRAIACALAAELVAAGGALAARLPGDGATLTQVAGDVAPRDVPSPGPSVVPSATPAASPTAVPTALPTALPSVSLPPLPPITLPPLPSLSLPPLPAIPPLCAADLGAEELPAFTKSVDARGDAGPVVGPVSGAGRIWYTNQTSSHVTGIDPADGSRVTIATGPDAIVMDVAGPYLWTVEGYRDVVAYDLATRKEVRRFGKTDTTDSTPYGYRAVRGDASGGAWMLGETDAGTVHVIRVDGQGATLWETQVAPSAPMGWSLERGEHLALHGGSLYVVLHAGGGKAEVHRLTADGAVAATATLPYGTGNMMDMPIAAGPDGVYVMLHENGGEPVRVMRLDPALKVTASARVPTGFDLAAGAGAVWLSGSDCSYNLARLDPVTLRRTGYWRKERGEEVVWSTIHGGHLWTLYAPESVPVALHRYDL